MNATNQAHQRIYNARKAIYSKYDNLLDDYPGYIAFDTINICLDGNYTIADLEKIMELYRLYLEEMRPLVIA